MTLPYLFASVTSATGAQLDADYAALGALTPIPCTVAGSNALTFTLSTNAPSVTGYANYGIFAAVAVSGNTGSTTAQVASLSALPVYKDTAAGPILLSGGEIVAGNLIVLTYDSALAGGAGGFHLEPLASAATVVGTSAYRYNVNSTVGSTVLSAGNLIGGSVETVLNMTGTQTAAASIQLPTVASLVSALSNPVAGQAWVLRVINSSSGAYALTITTNTGWTLNGTVTIADATWREFIITLSTLSSATLQSIGTGTYS